MINNFVDIPGYNGLYQINRKGVVISWNSPGKKRRTNSLVLKKRPDKYGYLTVSLSKNGVKKHKKIHRLIARVFLPNPQNKPQVNHKNYNKKDNRIENLEWATAKENTNHSYNSDSHRGKGEKHYRSKLNKKQVEAIKKKYESTNISQAEIAESYGVSRQNIGCIVRDETWQRN